MAFLRDNIAIEMTTHTTTGISVQNSSVLMCGILMDDAGRHSTTVVRNEFEFEALMGTGFGHAIDNSSQIFVLLQRDSQGTPLRLGAADSAKICERIGPSLDVSKLFGMFQIHSNDYYVLRTSTQFNDKSAHVSYESFETSCMLKFVEKNDKGLMNSASWSLRQAGFYQKYDPSTKTNRIILIRPSEAMKKNLRSNQQQRSDSWSSTEHWTAVPSLLLGGLSENWTEYITQIYAEIYQLGRDTLHTDPYQHRNGEADVKSLGTAAYLLETVQKACHVISCNIKVLTALQDAARKRSQLEPERPTSSAERSSFDQKVEATARDLESFQDQLSLMEQQLDVIMAQIRDLVQLRNLYMNERLTRRTITEARAVRLLSILTLLFVPPSLTMSFIQMDLVHVTSIEHGLLRLSADGLLWFWFAITMALIVIVVIGLLAWKWRTPEPEFDEIV